MWPGASGFSSCTFGKKLAAYAACGPRGAREWASDTWLATFTLYSARRRRTRRLRERATFHACRGTCVRARLRETLWISHQSSQGQTLVMIRWLLCIYIYIYIYVYREREREMYIHISIMAYGGYCRECAFTDVARSAAPSSGRDARLTEIGGPGE